MSRSNGRRSSSRTPGIEQLETRQVMSAVPLATLQVAPVEQSAVVSTMATNAHALTGLTNAQAEFGFNGKGQTVAVIDTGIAYTHPALGGGYGAGYRVVGGYDFTNNTNNPYDFGPYGSHGTHVAGIIGANDAAGTGVASGVDLVSLRVFDNSGNGNFAWVDSALKWVHQHRNDYANPITAINLSLGTQYNGMTVPNWAMLESDFAQLEADGIFIAVAAGNSFTSYNTPGLSYPAVSSHVVAVSSSDANGQLSYFSQRADRVIVAPGSNIRSTVPDYVGNLNGKDDDYANYSGTSMASPYVAGASVLIRQAMQFVGRTNITEWQIYNVMRDTATSVYDAATNASYKSLNLQKALESVMGPDEYGNDAANAFSLGSLQSTFSVNGVVGTLTDKDYFSFTATQTGTVTLTVNAKDGMVPQWSFNGQTSSGNTLTFNVVAGQKYTGGIGTTGAIGHYTLSGKLTAAQVAPEAVDFRDAKHLNVAGESWFAFSAKRTGILSVDAFFNSANGNVGLEIYDANHNLIRGVTSGNGERIDLNVNAGDVFYVRLVGTNADVEARITNLVQQNGKSVTVFGTTGNDTFVFTAGATQKISINGVEYSFTQSSANKFTFDGGAGNDTARFTLTSGNETVTARPGSVDITGQGFEAHAINSENNIVNGNGGQDVANLTGSAGNDTLLSRPNQAVLYGTGYREEVNGFAYITANGGGGIDAAFMYDSQGNDLFTLRPTSATMQGTGFANVANNFGYVFAYASNPGDVAQIYDADGNNLVKAKKGEVSVSNSKVNAVLSKFGRVVANANPNGRNQAQVAALDFIFEKVGKWV